MLGGSSGKRGEVSPLRLLRREPRPGPAPHPTGSARTLPAPPPAPRPPPPVAAPLRSGQSRISPGSSRSLSRQPRAGPANPSARWSCGRKHKSRCPGTYFSRGHLTSTPLRSASAAPAGGAAPWGRRHLPGPDTCRAPSRRRLRLRERCPGLHPVRPQPGAGAEPRGRCVSRAGGASGAGLGRGVRESRPLGSSLPPQPPHLRGTCGASGLPPQPHRKMEPVRSAMPAPPPAPSPPRPTHGPRSPRAGAPRPVPVVTALPTQNPLLTVQVRPVSLKESGDMPGCPSGRTRGKLTGEGPQTEPLASGAGSGEAFTHKRPQMLTHGSPLPPARKEREKFTLQIPYSTTAMEFSTNACSAKSSL